jgi:hypothetical protein
VPLRTEAPSVPRRDRTIARPGLTRHLELAEVNLRLGAGRRLEADLERRHALTSNRGFAEW